MGKCAITQVDRYENGYEIGYETGRAESAANDVSNFILKTVASGSISDTTGENDNRIFYSSAVELVNGSNYVGSSTSTGSSASYANGKIEGKNRSTGSWETIKSVYAATGKTTTVDFDISGTTYSHIRMALNNGSSGGTAKQSWSVTGLVRK